MIVRSALIRLVAVLALWLAFPLVALADDPNEAGTFHQNPLGAAALGGAAAAAGGYFGGRKPKGPPLPEFGQGGQKPEPPGFWQRFKNWFNGFFGG